MTLPAPALAEISLQVRGGFLGPRRLARFVLQDLYAPGELDEAEVEAAVAAEFAAHDRSQANWAEVTDCDRLDTAFAALDVAGIMAMQNVADMIGHAYEDVGEAHRRRPDRDRFRGFCFYPGQDRKRAIGQGYLQLSYGPFGPDRSEAAGAEIGVAVANALHAAGLTIEWDGTYAQRVVVQGIDWQRRRPHNVDQRAEMADLIFDAVAPYDEDGRLLCATIEIEGQPDAWLQVTSDKVNFAYPPGEEPKVALGDILAAWPQFRLDDWQGGTYATLDFDEASAEQLATLADLLLTRLFALEDYWIAGRLSYLD